MRTRDLSSSRARCLRVVPRPRGNWIVATEHDDALSEHATATEAEMAAVACLREGEEVVVYDRYHRCRRRGRPAPGDRAARPARVNSAHSEPEPILRPGPDRSLREAAIDPLPSATGSGNFYLQSDCGKGEAR